MTKHSNNSDFSQIRRHPNAFGQYGYEPTNPMLAQDIPESKKLLAELMLADGSPISYEREGSQMAPNLGSPVDRYAIYKATGEKICTLYMFCYYGFTVYSAPEGFTLATVWANKQQKPWWKFWAR